MRSLVVAGMILSMATCGSARAGDHTGAVLGGVAAGLVGGAVLGSVLSQHPRPDPVYVQPGRPVIVDEVEEAPPRRVYVRPAAVEDGFDDQAFRLHERCDDGDRHACIRFGVLIGQHRERVAQWRRSHPDFFSYEN